MHFCVKTCKNKPSVILNSWQSRKTKARFINTIRIACLFILNANAITIRLKCPTVVTANKNTSVALSGWCKKRSPMRTCVNKATNFAIIQTVNYYGLAPNLCPEIIPLLWYLTFMGDINPGLLEY